MTYITCEELLARKKPLHFLRVGCERSCQDSHFIIGIQRWGIRAQLAFCGCFGKRKHRGDYTACGHPAQYCRENEASQDPEHQADPYVGFDALVLTFVVDYSKDLIPALLYEHMQGLPLQVDFVQTRGQASK